MANASRDANVDYEQIAREIVEEADRDRRRRGRASTATPRRRAARGAVARRQGRRGWLREAKRPAWRPSARAAPADPARSRPKRLKEAKRRLDEELWTEAAPTRPTRPTALAARMKDGRRFGRPPKPYTPPRHAEGTDQPHRPRLAARQGPARLDPGLQRPGRHQRAPDRLRRRGHDRRPGLRSPRARCSTPPARELARAGVDRDARGRAGRRRLLAPARRWNAIVADGTQVLIPPDASKRKSTAAAAGPAASTTSCAGS